MLPNQPDDTPMIHSISNTVEVTFTQHTLEDIIRTIKKLEDDTTAYAIVDTEDGKIYAIKKGSLHREFIDAMLGKKTVLHTDFGNVDIVPRENGYNKSKEEK